MVFKPQYEAALSSVRFDRYRQETNDDDHAWALYQWNQELSSAAMFLAADLEVTLRNTIHDRLSTHFEQPDWWASARLRLDDETRRTLGSAAKKHGNALRNGSAGPGRVVSELMFGAWVNLVGSGGRTNLGETVDYETNLWRPALRLGFATGEVNRRGRPRRPTRDEVFSRAANFKKLRNRIAHHEPIYDGIVPPGGGDRSPLATVCKDGIELLGWMAPELAAVHTSAARIPTLLANRPKPPSD